MNSGKTSLILNNEQDGCFLGLGWFRLFLMGVRRDYIFSVPLNSAKYFQGLQLFAVYLALNFSKMLLKYLRLKTPMPGKKIRTCFQKSAIP